MALYPIKMLKDNKGQYFFPFITDDAILMNGDDRTIGQRLDEIEQSIQDLGTVLKFCGVVSTYDDLPISANIGDVYVVENNSSEYVYVNGSWEELGPMVDLSNYYTKAESDETMKKLISDNQPFNILYNNFNNSLNPFRFPKYKKGMYLFPNTIQKTVYFSTKETGEGTSSVELLNCVLYVVKGLGDTIENGDTVGIVIDSSGKVIYILQNQKGDAAVSPSVSPTYGNIVYDSKYTTFQRPITFSKGFNTSSAIFNDNCPECSVNPTSDNHLVNKSYVDAAINTTLGSVNLELESIINGGA